MAASECFLHSFNIIVSSVFLACNFGVRSLIFLPGLFRLSNDRSGPVNFHPVLLSRALSVVFRWVSEDSSFSLYSEISGVSAFFLAAFSGVRSG